MIFVADITNCLIYLGVFNGLRTYFFNLTFFFFLNPSFLQLTLSVWGTICKCMYAFISCKLRDDTHIAGQI